MEAMPSMPRDFSSISPSARWLCLARAHSGLPYAKQAAEVMFGAEAVAAAAVPADEGETLRRAHFARRARSVDEALDAVGAKCVLELAAGFSLRGMSRAGVYVETDLPELVEMKRELVRRLGAAHEGYRVEALDALDAAAFARVSGDTGPEGKGPLAVVNEGLLMYLSAAEKQALAANVRAVLAARRGWWITADIYLRRESPVASAARPAEVQKFLAAHNVEAQKFGSFEEAEGFFSSVGFSVSRRLAPPASDRALIRETWILTLR